MIFAQPEDCIDPDQIDLDIFCLEIFNPVCGCDGITYSNDCYAFYYGGVTSWEPGECSIQECFDSTMINELQPCPVAYIPVCGCDGITYWNSCDALYYNGITEWTEGECNFQSDCLDLGDIDFGFCDFPLGIALINGSCQSISGCDWTVNDVNYQPWFFDNMDDCMACIDSTGCLNLSGINFGLCDAILGIGYTSEGCNYISGCSTIGSDGIDYGDYFFENMADCEALCGNDTLCVDPSVIDSTIFCIQVIDPVCGCNGITYNNECEAMYWYGVTSWTDGECPPEPDCMDLGGIDFGDCDMAMGIAFIDGECSFLSGCGWVVDNVDYSGYSFESMEACAAACGDSLCIDVSLIDVTVDCGPFLEPVCGCDSITYINDCVATYYIGVSEFYDGPCAQPVNCVDSVQINPKMACPDVWLPVCGCDGLTYGNDCEAWYYAGIQSWTEGECDSTISVLELPLLDAVLFPNPTHGKLTIVFEKAIKFSIDVNDLQGRINRHAEGVGTQYEMSIADLSKGIYMVTIRTELGIITKKVVKE